MKRFFKPGEPVFHRRLGFGTIVAEWGSWIDVDPGHGKELTINGGNVFEVEFSNGSRRAVSGDSLELDCRLELAGKNR